MVWLDSDAFVRDVTLDLPSLLRRYGGEPSTSRGVRAADMTDAYFGWDAPYSLGPNAGFAVLRGEGGAGGEGGEGSRGIGAGGRGGRGIGTVSAAGALEMLAVWWQLYHGQYGLEHAFEQHALHWQLLHMQPFRRRIDTLRLRAMQPTAEGVYPDAVVHLDHNAGTKTRIWTMACAAAELLATPTPTTTTATTAATTTTATAAASSAASAPTSRAADTVTNHTSAFAAWLPLLRGPRNALSYARRQQAVVAVVRAAGADLAAMRRGGSNGGGRGGGGSSGGAPRCAHRWGVTPSSAPSSSAAAAAAPRFVATATTPTHTPTHTSPPLFDATAAAAALLPLPQRFARSGGIAGMPLQLRNCSISTGRAVAAAGVESGTEGGKEARGGRVALELLAPWQARGDISPLDIP